MRSYRRDVVSCILSVSLVLCCAPSLWALEIIWGAPEFGDQQSAAAPGAAPEAPASPADSEGAGLEDGFRGVSWGTTREDMEDELHMEFLQCLELPGGRLNCALKGANKSIRDIPLILLRYKFVNDVFYGISFKYDSKYEKELYAIYKEVLGPPTGYRESFPVWDGEDYAAWATDTHFSFSSKKVIKRKRHRGGTF